jgi:hypothetical protein
MDEVSSGSIPTTCTLIRLSQTTLKEGRDDPAWDSDRAEYCGRPGEPSINVFGMDTSGAEKLFDTSVYDPSICWCLYNVLAVKMQDKKARRIGIGKVHIRAFDKIAKMDQRIELG